MVWHGYARRRCGRMWALEAGNIDTPGGVVGRGTGVCVRAVAAGRVGRGRALRRPRACDGVTILARACGRSGGRVRAVVGARALRSAPPGHKKTRGLRRAGKITDGICAATAASAGASGLSAVRARRPISAVRALASSPQALGSTPDRSAGAPPRPARE